MRLGDVHYFADENALGVARILREEHGREDIVMPGHHSLPGVPRGTADLDWIPYVARMGWIVLSRDRHIRTRPAELRAFRESGLRAVWLGGKHDQTPRQLADVFLRHELRLTQLSTRLGPGPWAATMTPTGVREVRVRGIDV